MLKLEVNSQQAEPKYLQIAHGIIAQIEAGNLKIDDRLPSVNKLSSELSVSRETVFKALNHLSAQGVVHSSNRKGYFIRRSDVKRPMRIFLLFDKMTPFKQKIYEAFVEQIGEEGLVDIFFHHHNIQLFRSLVGQNLSSYTHFVLVTFFKEPCTDVLNLIPPEKRLILDNYEKDLNGEQRVLFQDFQKDIYEALSSVKDALGSYKKIILIAHPALYHLHHVVPGFRKFCEDHKLNGEIIDEITENHITEGHVILSMSAEDVELVNIIKICRAKKLKIGTQVGIISYNDTPVKEILAGGITVITTDFTYMGKKAAEMIQQRSYDVISNPTKLIRRNSL